jgi:YHS domain-containing protein
MIMTIFAKAFKRLAIVAVFLCGFHGVGQAAETPVYTGTFSDQAVSGYDTVAYFKEGKPVKGSDKFVTDYKGAKWLFSNPENLAAFKAAPEKFAPQYGGYCSYAVGEKNTLASADPEAWKIIDGKLYLNYDKDIQALWQKDTAGFIKKADANWPKLSQQ